MKLVIIGGYGQVGQEFQKHMYPEDFQPLSHEEIEVDNEQSVRSCLQGLEFDAVINLAAFHNTDQCEEMMQKAFLVNSIGAGNVARVSQELNKKVVFFSTDYVFGLDSRRTIPYLETDSVAPVNVYGASKAAGEMMVRATNKDHLIIRTSSVFGVVTSKKGWTFPEMIYNKARSGESLRVVNDQIMSPTYTRELAYVTLELLRKDVIGTVHVTGEGECSWYDFASETLRLLNINHKIEPVPSSTFPSKAKRPEYSVLNSNLFEKYQIRSMKPWNESLKEYLIEKGELEE